ncbi:uncharacterized protein LOC131875983 [Cryptomeria japonica]|uniref:uncharacterized protein LOC131875983 n=1 Tax=Cryptomeria japonica TaxID=3369 RepID=UPI0027DA4F6F|nr:uncharacterized protein LOC131875983 [Cryptomeria japonica]
MGLHDDLQGDHGSDSVPTHVWAGSGGASGIHGAKPSHCGREQTRGYGEPKRETGPPCGGPPAVGAPTVEPPCGDNIGGGPPTVEPSCGGNTDGVPTDGGATVRWRQPCGGRPHLKAPQMQNINKYPATQPTQGKKKKKKKTHSPPTHEERHAAQPRTATQLYTTEEGGYEGVQRPHDF